MEKEELNEIENHGITIISLVITIIILLILAAVTISLTLGENGIFGLAQNAGKNYMEAQNNEIAGLQNYGNTIGQLVGSTNKSDIKKFTIEAFDKKDVWVDADKPTKLNLQIKKDIKKAILVYSVGMSDNGQEAKAKARDIVVKCSSNDDFTCRLLISISGFQGGSVYSGSALQEIYELENIKANDTISIEGYMQYKGGCMASLISYEM